jgi:putative Ca2+/H+ antiporter (TMEM165/GDT1 family)
LRVAERHAQSATANSKEKAMRDLIVIFVTVFVAELGDKTQLATMLFASDGKTHPLAVFAAAAIALVLGTAISVALGALAGRYLQAVPIKLVAGILFIAIGIWSIAQHVRGA